jgi:hypothetical protein
MARIRMSFAGYPSGKIGDVVFKRRNNNIYISMAPVKKKEQTEAQYVLRRKFSFCNGLSSAVIKNDIFFRRWEDARIESESAYTKVMKVNMKLVNMEDLSGITLIPDDEPFKSEVLDWSFRDNNLVITFRSPEIRYSGISMQGVLLLNEPSENISKYFRFIPFYNDKSFPEDGGITFKESFNSTYIDFYNGRRIIVNIALKDRQGKTSRFSETMEIKV